MQEYPDPMDKATWPRGPWDDEPDKVSWTTRAGLPGLIVRNRFGSLCGYCAVTKEHPDYEKSYDNVEVEVHGGLTYAEHCQGEICHVPEPGEPDDVFWFGFDCAHSMDITPGLTSFLHPWPTSVYRDLAYVQNEVESLAEQLAARRQNA